MALCKMHALCTPPHVLCTKYFVILHNLNIIGPKNCHLQLVTTKKTKFGWKRTFLWTLTDTILSSLLPTCGVCSLVATVRGVEEGKYENADVSTPDSARVAVTRAPRKANVGQGVGGDSDQAGHITRVSTGELLLLQR